MLGFDKIKLKKSKEKDVTTYEEPHVPTEHTPCQVSFTFPHDLDKLKNSPTMLKRKPITRKTCGTCDNYEMFGCRLHNITVLHATEACQDYEAY